MQRVSKSQKVLPDCGVLYSPQPCTQKQSVSWAIHLANFDQHLFCDHDALTPLLVLHEVNRVPNSCGSHQNKQHYQRAKFNLSQFPFQNEAGFHILAYVSEKIKLKDSLSFTFILVPANFLPLEEKRW